MLVLQRSVGEKIIIPLPDGREIKIVLVSAIRDKAKIGIDAPINIPVHREELAPGGQGWTARRH